MQGSIPAETALSTINVFETRLNSVQEQYDLVCRAKEALDLELIRHTRLEPVFEELKDLNATLANIEEARPFEDLSVDDVGNAHPHIVKTVETMVKKGKWTVPGMFYSSCSPAFTQYFIGYKEKFGDMSIM